MEIEINKNKNKENRINKQNKRTYTERNLKNKLKKDAKIRRIKENEIYKSINEKDIRYPRYETDSYFKNNDIYKYINDEVGNELYKSGKGGFIAAKRNEIDHNEHLTGFSEWSQSYASNYQPTYFQSLIDPCQTRGCKITGMNKPTVSVKRVMTLQLATSSQGGAALFCWPTALLDSSFAPANGQSIVFTDNTNVPAYNPNIGGNACVAGLNYQMPANVTQSWRLVSASIQFSNKTPKLNRGGTFHGGLMPIDNPLNAPTAAGAAIFVGPPITFLQGHPTYRKCESADNDMEIVWIPDDSRLTSDRAINTNYQTGDAAFVEDAIVFYCNAVSTTQQFIEVMLFANYELIPANNSVLTGMETLTPHREIATQIWGEVRRHTDIVRVYNSLSDHNNELKYTVGTYLGLKPKKLVSKNNKYVYEDEDERKLALERDKKNFQ